MVWRFVTSLRSLLSRGRAERELEEELAYHVEMETDANIQRGVPPGEARRLALISLGGAEQTRLQVRDVWRTFVDTTLQDVGYALRRMRREPGIAAATILTVAVTVGLAAATYAAAESVLLRPFPFDQPESLVAVWKAKDDIDFYPLPVPEMLDLKSRASAVKDVGGFTREGFVLSGPKGARWAEAFLVTANLFEVLGVRPVRGRTFAAGDGLPGHDKVLVIGETLWREAFDADPGIIGREVSLRAEDSAPEMYRIVGVVAPDLQLFYPAPLRAELYVPRVLTTQDRTEAARSMPSLITVARLQPGSTAAQAAAEITAVMAALTREHPRVSLPGATTRVLPLHEELVGRTRPVFVLLAGGALVFLLIGCANVTNLLLSGGLQRQRELATRVALGCTRPRLVGQLATEQLALVFLGSVVGVILSARLTTVFRTLAPERLPRASEIRFHGEAVPVALGLALFAWVLSGLLSAVWLSNAGWVGTSPAAATGRRRGRRLRSALVLAETALMMGLLGAAALLAHSLFRLDTLDIGFEAKGIFAAQVVLPERRDTPQVSLQFEQSLLDRLRQDVRVGGASMTSELPFTWGVLDTIRTSDSEKSHRALVTSTDDQYLPLLKVRLLRGRWLVGQDLGRPRVAVINEALAGRLGSGDVIGRRILIEREWREVVGAVADVTEIGQLRAGLIRQAGLARLTLPAAYVPRAARTTN